MDRKTHPEYDSSRDTEGEPNRDPGRRHGAGRLVEDGDGLVDEEKDLVADAAEDELEDQSAEEAAVRIDDEEPGGVTDRSDAYLENERDQAG